MTLDLERLAVQRAEEQMRSFSVREPSRHDGWAIKPTKYEGRANGKGVTAPPRRRCLAGDCAGRAVNHGYCHMHWLRISRGQPYDSDLYVTTNAERRRFGLSGAKRAGKVR